jgi:hypothetical protein
VIHEWGDEHVAYDTLVRAHLSNGQVAVVSLSTSAANHHDAEMATVLVGMLMFSSVGVSVPLLQGGKPDVKIPLYQDV